MLVHKLISKLCILLLVATGFLHCGSGFGPQGGLFTSTTLGVYGTEVRGDKTGSACSFHILGLVALGNGSVEAAAEEAGITEVTTIDLDSLSILFLFGKLCTVVRGN